MCKILEWVFLLIVIKMRRGEEMKNVRENILNIFTEDVATSVAAV